MFISQPTLSVTLKQLDDELGVAMLPQSQAVERVGVVIRQWHLPAPTRRVGLCFAAQALESPALRALHDYFQTHRPPQLSAA